jgi:hypothetical protein
LAENNIDYYILFPNHMEGLRLQKALKDAGVKCIIAPTPRQLSLNCGMSLRLSAEQVEQAKEIIRTTGAITDGVVAVGRPEK